MSVEAREPEVKIDRDAIASVERVIRPRIRRTPVVELDAGDVCLSCPALTLKLELLQHAGSFKPRGAFANLLTRPVPACGVAAASGGNHGTAVAYAAMKLGVPAKIFVPRIASPAKIERIRSYGADLMIDGERYADAVLACDEYVSRTGALPVHAFDQPETMLGQGSVALELEAQAPALDTVLVAVGGGGLIGGVSAWYAGRAKVVGVEPEASPTLYRAFEAGRPVDAETGGIAADSLAPRRVGEQVFPVARRYVAEVVLVGEDAIRAAQAKLWDSLRIVAEPGGAAAFAAVMSGRYRPRNASAW